MLASSSLLELVHAAPFESRLYAVGLVVAEFEDSIAFETQGAPAFVHEGHVAIKVVGHVEFGAFGVEDLGLVLG